MEIDTTSINELPIANTQPQSGEDSINQANLNQEHIVLDNQSNQLPQHAVSEKKVRFQDAEIQPQKNTTENIKNPNLDINLDTKIVLLSTILFFLMFDPKVKKYLMNILVQIFGSFIKTEHGNFTQIGILIYALFFGSTLLSIVKTVDISSFHLSL